MFDLSYLLFMLPGLLLGLYAQIKLSSTYNKYVEVPAESGISGARAAREILDRAGLADVPVEEIQGHLTDHYDPTKRALFLSSENYRGRSLAAVGVAAHEAGHALQDQAGYAPLKFRMFMVPATQFADKAWIGILLLSFVFHGLGPLFLNIAIGIFCVIALFQVVTLPVEFNASSRAKEQLIRLGIVGSNERYGVSKVLNAAALTYVAAMVGAVMQLLHLLAMRNDRD
jgi:uncharacterized protein